MIKRCAVCSLLRDYELLTKGHGHPPWPPPSWSACCTCSWSGPGTAPTQGHVQTPSLLLVSPNEENEHSTDSIQESNNTSLPETAELKEKQLPYLG